MFLGFFVVEILVIDLLFVWKTDFGACLRPTPLLSPPSPTGGQSFPGWFEKCKFSVHCYVFAVFSSLLRLWQSTACFRGSHNAYRRSPQHVQSVLLSCFRGSPKRVFAGPRWVFPGVHNTFLGVDRKCLLRGTHIEVVRRSFTERHIRCDRFSELHGESVRVVAASVFRKLREPTGF